MRCQHGVCNGLMIFDPGDGSWINPRRVFVCSMGDLFHKDVDFFWIDSVMQSIWKAESHTFFVLTKRPDRMLKYWKALNHGLCEFPPNLWLGVSVENQRTADERIPILCQIPAAKKFVSVEPMLEDIHFYRGWFGLNGINWVIVGGETGPKARPMNPDWARSLLDQCQATGVPFFFKSWGKCPYPSNTEISAWISAGYDPYLKPKENRFLDGREWREFPR